MNAYENRVRSYGHKLVQIKKHPLPVFVVGLFLADSLFYLYLLFPDIYQQRAKTWYRLTQAVEVPWATHELIITVLLVFKLLHLFSKPALSFRLPNSTYQCFPFLFFFAFLSTGLAQYAGFYLHSFSLEPFFHYWFWILSELLFFSFGCFCWFSVQPRTRDRNVFLFAIALCVSILMRGLFKADWLKGEFAHEVTTTTAGSVLSLIYPLAEITYGATLSRIVVGDFRIRIDTSCSGTESFIVMFIYLCFWVLFFRRYLATHKAFLIFPLGLIGVWLGNVVRIVFLVIIGVEYSVETAVRGFHSSAGWILFNLIAASLVFYSLKPTTNQTKLSETSFLKNPTTRYLMPLLSIFFIALFVNIFDSSPLSPLYLLKIAAGCAALWYFNPLGHGFRLFRYFRPSRRAFFASLFVLVTWVLMEEIRVAQHAPHAILKLNLSKDWIKLLPWVLGSSLLIPIVEELAFRGYLMRRLVGDENFNKISFQKTGFVALAISSVVFALGHVQFVGALFAGFVFGWLCYRERQLSSAIFAHGATNLGFSLYVVLAGRWALIS